MNGENSSFLPGQKIEILILFYRSFTYFGLWSFILLGSVVYFSYFSGERSNSVKEYTNAVPVKEIRDFTGALASKKAKKGIFITTSSFPNTVYEFVSQVEYKIILIDGERLADLMIEHSIGLATVNTYTVKTIDSDYFEEN